MYISNNIRLRQSTALAVSNFKHAQAQLLGFVIDSESHKFSSTAREALLINYSKFFEWLVGLETLVIKNGPVTKKGLEEQALTDFDTRIKSIHNTMRRYPQFFDSEFTLTWISVWQEEVDILKKFIISEFRGCSDTAPIFVNIVKALTQFMNHTLYLIHELDFILQHKDSSEVDIPFISIDIVDLEGVKGFGVVTPLKRLRKYTSLGFIKGSIEVKCYLTSDLLNSSADYSSAYEVVLSAFRKEGTDVIRVI